MRGDLVRILYDASKDNLDYIFGKIVECFDQDEKQVIAHFSNGSSDTFDLWLERTARAHVSDKPSCQQSLQILTGDWGCTWPTILSRE